MTASEDPADAQISDQLELLILNNRADVAAMMLAGCDDSEALKAAVSQLTEREAAQLVGAALSVGATVVRMTDRGGVTAREALSAVVAACRERRDELT